MNIKCCNNNNIYNTQKDIGIFDLLKINNIDYKYNNIDYKDDNVNILDNNSNTIQLFCFIQKILFFLNFQSILYSVENKSMVNEFKVTNIFSKIPSVYINFRKYNNLYNDFENSDKNFLKIFNIICSNEKLMTIIEKHIYTYKEQYKKKFHKSLKFDNIKKALMSYIYVLIVNQELNMFFFISTQWNSRLFIDLNSIITKFNIPQIESSDLFIFNSVNFMDCYDALTKNLFCKINNNDYYYNIYENIYEPQNSNFIYEFKYKDLLKFFHNIPWNAICFLIFLNTLEQEYLYKFLTTLIKCYLHDLFMHKNNKIVNTNYSELSLCLLNFPIGFNKDKEFIDDFYELSKNIYKNFKLFKNNRLDCQKYTFNISKQTLDTIVLNNTKHTQHDKQELSKMLTDIHQYIYLLKSSLCIYIIDTIIKIMEFYIEVAKILDINQVKHMEKEQTESILFQILDELDNIIITFFYNEDFYKHTDYYHKYCDKKIIVEMCNSSDNNFNNNINSLEQCIYTKNKFQQVLKAIKH